MPCLSDYSITLRCYTIHIIAMKNAFVLVYVYACLVSVQVLTYYWLMVAKPICVA